MIATALDLRAVELTEGNNFKIGFEISEGYTAGLLQSDLFLNIDASVLPQIGNYGVNGSQGLRLDPGSAVSLDFAAVAPAPVGWIDYYIKPVFAAGEELPVDFALGQAALAGFVKLDALGEVYVLHGDCAGNGVWLPTAYQTPLADNAATQWLRMTYRLDYTHLTWDLFLDGQLSRFDLGFIDPNAPPLSGFRLKGAALGSTYFDQFEAGFLNPLYPDADNDGMSDQYEQAHGLDSTRNDRNEDADHDGLSNIEELHLGLAAGDPDSDDDGRSDGAEYQSGSNPLEADPYNLTLLPFEEDFETYAPGPLDDRKNWQYDGGVAAVVAAAESQDGQFLELTASPGLTLDLSNPFNGSTASIVWTEFDISPVYFNHEQGFYATGQALESEPTALFYFSDEPALVAYDGKSAQFVNYPLELDSDLSQRLTLRHDYTTQTWSLWCNTLLVARDLGFARPQPFYSRLKFSQESKVTATLDNLRVATTRPTGLDSDGDGLPDEAEDPNANEIRDPGETDPFNPDSDGDGILDSLDSLWVADPVQDAAPLTLKPSGYKTLSFHFEPAEGYTTGPLAGQDKWEAAPLFEISADRGAAGSEQSLRSKAPGLSNAFAYARRYLSAEGEPVVWVSFQADMDGVYLDSIPVDTSNPAAAFALSSTRRIAAYDADAAQWQVAEESIPEDAWIRYDLRLDYANKTWSLCADGHLVFHELPFIDPTRASLSSLTLLQQGGKAAHHNWIDAIEFSNRIPAELDFDADGLDNELEVEIGSDPLRPDTDRDGMTDGWEFQYGLDCFTDDRLGDLDADGICNYTEYLQGSDPGNPDENGDGHPDGSSIAGQVRSELWFNTETNFKNFTFVESGKPDQVNPYSKLQGGRHGTHKFEGAFGHRLRAYLIAPESGLYRFWVSGGGQVGLWFKNDAGMQAPLQIINQKHSSLENNFTQRMGQSSLPVYLEAGQAYYLELLQRHPHSGGFYFAVGWQYGSMAEPEIIGAPHLRSFVHDPGDLDDDGLQDAAELASGLDPFDPTGAMGRLGNPDDDRFLNHRELREARDPFTPDDFPVLPWETLFPAHQSQSASPLQDWELNKLGSHHYTGAWQNGNDLFLAGFGRNQLDYVFAHKNLPDQPLRITTRVRYGHLLDTMAEAGIMLRSSLRKHDTFYRISFAPDGRIHSRCKPTVDDKEGTLNELHPYGYSNAWLRLEYDGGQLHSAYSYDGENWQPLDSLPFPHGFNGFYGPAITSHDPDEIVSAVFEDFETDTDTDRDGLWDKEEAALGTDPTKADSDNDGYSDFDEVRKRFTDPLEEDIKTKEYDKLFVSAKSAVQSFGRWELNEFNELQSKDISGALNFSFNLSTAGVYKIKIPVRHIYQRDTNAERPIVIHHFIDGDYIKTSSHLQEGKYSVENLEILLPHLKVGEHSFGLKWENVYEGRHISTPGVSIFEPTGFSGQMLEAWKNEYIAESESISETSALIESKVSPYCLEGKTHYLGMVEADDGSAVERGAGNGWYLNVSLPEDGSTKDIVIGFQQGGLNLTRKIKWSTTNITSAAAIVIRMGDSLRLLSGLGEGEHPVKIQVGNTTYITPSHEAVVHEFASAGIHLVKAIGDHSESELVVHVEALPEETNPPAVMRARTRTWFWENFNPDLEIDTGDIVSRRYDSVEQGTVVVFHRNEIASPKNITARIGANDSIIKSIPLEGFWVRENAEDYTTSSNVEDGVVATNNKIICSKLPDDVRLCISIFKAGAVFEDGSIEKWITGEDLDEFGRYDLVILKPTSLIGATCHAIKAFEGDAFINYR